MIRKTLWWIALYAFFVYALLVIWPNYDFYPLLVEAGSSAQTIPLYLLLGGVFWLIYDIIRYILKFITIPLNAISFWIVHLILNVWVLYLIAPITRAIDNTIMIQMWSILEVTIMAILLSLVGLIIKYL